MQAFLVTLALFDALALGLGAWLLWRGRRPLRWSRNLLVLATYAAVLLVIAVPLARWLTGSPFASFRVSCSVLFCILAPLMVARGADHLWTRRQGPRGRGCVAFGLLVVVAGLGMEGVYAHAHFIGPRNLRVQRYQLVSERLAGLARPIGSPGPRRPGDRRHRPLRGLRVRANRARGQT